MTIDQFIVKWKKVELKERAAAQEHFLDLCHLLDHPTPAEAARALDEARRNWLGDRSGKRRTLTALYNEKPTWLLDAHRKLDGAVFAAYAWDANISDELILQRLLELNLLRSAPLARITP